MPDKTTCARDQYSLSHKKCSPEVCKLLLLGPRSCEYPICLWRSVCPLIQVPVRAFEGDETHSVES
jgi:hypothetical protein